MKNIQNLPYCEFIKRNSAEYIHSVEVLAGQFQSVLSLLLKSLSDFMVVLVILFLLILENPMALFLLVLIFGGFLLIL